MLSDRYRNVTTNCQDGEYKVIIFITLVLNLKKVILITIKTVLHMLTTALLTIPRQLFTI